MIDEEVAKYKKKKESDTSKADAKSNHKHTYKECLLIEKGNPHYAKYCTVCGKITDLKFSEAEKTPEGFFRMLDKDEVFEKYRKLEHIVIDDIFQKYVPLGE